MSENRVTNERTGQNWKPIPSFPSYEASSEGRIRRVAPAPGARVGRILRPGRSTGGYLKVVLSEGGVVRTCKVHQLVAEAFHGPRPDGMDTCHENGVRTDNRACNLRYDTRRGNFADMVAHGTHLQGERKPSALLAEQQVREILNSPIRGTRGAAGKLAPLYGVHRKTIQDIWGRKTWAHIEDTKEDA